MKKSNPNPKVVVSWRSTGAEPSHLWRKLWSRLLLNKKRTLPKQAREDKLTGGAKEGRPHKSE